MSDDRRGIERFRKAVEAVSRGLPQASLPHLATTAAAPKALLPEEIFLRGQEEHLGRGTRAIFVAAAVLLHVIVFAIHFPEITYRPPEAKSTRRVMIVRQYTPPPPPKKERPRIERRLTKKVPLPDPTPDEIEPVVTPEPEIEPPPFDPDMEIRIGTPEPPPATGPLMAGVDGVTEPELIPETKVEPAYPEAARRARLEGRVILQLVVRRDGTVGEVTVLKAPALEVGFSEAARAAVTQWRYRPARQAGRPVDVYLTVVVNFQIE